ncbi:MAG: DUF1127 domain-containing protein [Sulfitobacter sp.]
MATFDTFRTATGSSAAASGIFAIFFRTIASFVAWNDARATRNTLAKLSDRELDDIGLIRGDIDEVAMSNFIR